MTRRLEPLRSFVGDMGALIAAAPDEATILAQGGDLLRGLVARDDWLPDEYAQPDPARYRQNLLYLDNQRQFSVVAFVWAPGQATSVHDHTVWGLVGLLRGGELSQAYDLANGRPRPSGPVRRLSPGSVEAVSPRVGDLHRVANAFHDRTSISIHVYGADIGGVSRHTYDDAGRPRTFISGYSNLRAPDLWGVSSGACS